MAELELLMTSIQKAELESYFLMNNCDFEFVTNSKLKVDDDMVDLVKRIISDRGISFLEKATVNDIKMIKKGDHFLVNENGEIHEYIASDDAIYSGRRWSVRVDAYTFDARKGSFVQNAARAFDDCYIVVKRAGLPQKENSEKTLGLVQAKSRGGR